VIENRSAMLSQLQDEFQRLTNIRIVFHYFLVKKRPNLTEFLSGLQRSELNEIKAKHKKKQSKLVAKFEKQLKA
jgi:hypothetical protein